MANNVKIHLQLQQLIEFLANSIEECEKSDNVFLFLFFLLKVLGIFVNF